MRGARTLMTALLLASIGAGCGDDTTPTLDAGPVEDATSPIDAETIDAGPPPRDVGELDIDDPGACETWGLEDEGEAIEGASSDGWTFVPFPEAHCMDGSSTGIGVRLSPTGDSRVVIYLEGGGACFDSISCATVSGADGFGAAHLTANAGRLDQYGIFRDDDSNPVRNWNYVYVPYCSGDAHTGRNVAGFEGREQIGARNVEAYLRRLVPTFRDAEMILLAGASAGGLGAMANYDAVQQAFGCTPVHLLDDSGPVLDDWYLRVCLQTKVRELWGLTPPADCEACTQEDGGGLSVMWDYLAQKYPDRRFGFSSTMADRTFRTFFGFGFSHRCSIPQIISEADYAEAMLHFRDQVAAPYDNIKTFYQPGDAHTFLAYSLTRPSADGVTLSEWIDGLVTGDPSWSHVGP